MKKWGLPLRILGAIILVVGLGFNLFLEGPSNDPRLRLNYLGLAVGLLLYVLGLALTKSEEN